MQFFQELIPARYILAVLGCIAMAIIYGLKVNLSVAMVAMLNHTGLAEMAGKSGIHQAVSSEPVCEATNSSETMEVIII